MCYFYCFKDRKTIMKKCYLAIVLMLVLIPGYGVSQEVGIDVSYDRYKNELTLVLTNKSDKELWVRNQSSLDWKCFMKRKTVIRCIPYSVCSSMIG